jgi:O-antigen ligase/tetratricopeptide (TPR) repeat protein
MAVCSKDHSAGGSPHNDRARATVCSARVGAVILFRVDFVAHQHGERTEGQTHSPPHRRNIAQHVLLLILGLALLLTHDSITALGTRLTITSVAIAAAFLISINYQQKAKAFLLASPLDYGWLLYSFLTGISVLLAPSPRRSVEFWLWMSAIQLPFAYGALHLFRRGWPERTFYRAILGAVGYYLVLTVLFTARYLSIWAAARAAEIAPPGFRIFGVLSHPNIFAMVLALALPCIAAYFFTIVHRRERMIVVVWLAVAVLALFATGSRTGLFATLFGLACALILALAARATNPLSRLRTWVAARPLVMGALALSVFVVIGAAIYFQFGRPQQDSGLGRLGFYENALHIFAAHPLAGDGPGGFVRNEFSIHSVPPYHPLPHAHNIYLGTAAESGLLGIIGFAALLLSAVRVCFLAWRTHPKCRSFIAGPTGGLLAFAVFGLLDSPISQFGPFFLATVLLSFIAAQISPNAQGEGLGVKVNQADSGGETNTRSQRPRLILVSAWGVVILCLCFVLLYGAAWIASPPDLPPPADLTALIESAQRLDSVSALNPTDALLTLQAGYHWAYAAWLDTESLTQGHRQHLQNAIERFERALERDSWFGIHYVNLAALYLQAGRAAESVSAARRATVLAGSDAAAWLMLGIAQEINTEDSTAAYLQTLKIEPRWSEAAFWQETEARRTALTQYLNLAAELHRYDDWMVRGNMAWTAGHNEEARLAYQEAEKVAPTNSAATLSRGLAARVQGNSSAARTLLLQVTAMEIADVEDQQPAIDAQVHLADMARERGDRQELAQACALAYRLLTTRGWAGFGTKGDGVYAITVYHRSARVGDYLPQVRTLDVDEMARFLLFPCS